jgi:hypothetical protein
MQQIIEINLLDDPHNQLVIAYNLVIDNKRIETAKAEYKDFFAHAGMKKLYKYPKHFSFLFLIIYYNLCTQQYRYRYWPF